MKTILVPIDLSSATTRVCDAACALAKLIKARVVLFNVFQPPPVVANEYGVTAPEIQIAIMDNAREISQHRLAELVKRCRQRRVQARGIYRVGAPVMEIMRQCRRQRAAYIVIGSHGHTAFYDMVIGGTTHGVLRGAVCPVLVIPIAPASKSRARK